jgi:phosphoribosylamine--glycine ligase
MVFEDMKEALRFVKGSSYPLVIKADGLAAGKGVSIVKNYELAEKTIKNMMQKRQFGAAGAKIVVEDFLVGEEASIFAFTDGKHVLPLIPSQDHKRVGDGDTGPNTGGMGAYAPVPFVSEKVQKDILDLVLEPTVAGMGKNSARLGLLYGI